MSLILVACAVLISLMDVDDDDTEYEFGPKFGQDQLKFERQRKKSKDETRNQYSNSSDIDVANYLLDKSNNIAFDKVDMLLKLDTQYKVRFKKPENEDIDVEELKGLGWLPLIPGDVVSYNCIMGGRKDQEHWAIYVGSGYFVHTWWKATTAPSQITDVVLAKISEKTIQNKGRILCTYVSKFAPVFEKKGHQKSCASQFGEYRIIDVDHNIFKKEGLHAVNPRERVIKALNMATNGKRDTSYHVTTSNCQHFVANIVFNPKAGKDGERQKCEAISRLLDVSLLGQGRQSGNEYDAYQKNKHEWHEKGLEIINSRIKNMSDANYFVSTVLKLDEGHKIAGDDAGASSST